MGSLASDFWWLPENVVINELVIGLGNHKMITDDEDMPPLTSCYCSISQEGTLSNDIVYYPVHFLEQWRSACKNVNIYRTLKIFGKNTKEAMFLGPFLVDIDNEKEDLDAAQVVAKDVLEYLITQLKTSESDLRIFFTGHKGFNIEMRPKALNISGSVPDQIRLSSKKLDSIIDYLSKDNNVQDSTTNVVDNRGTVIDRIYGNRFGFGLKHPFVRLHNSINKWITNDNRTIARKKMEITCQQLWKKSASEISSDSEVRD